MCEEKNFCETTYLEESHATQQFDGSVSVGHNRKKPEIITMQPFSIQKHVNHQKNDSIIVMLHILNHMTSEYSFVCTFT